MANNFTEYNGNAEAFAGTLFGSSGGISLVSGSVTYFGKNSAASTFDSLSLGKAQISGPGILLTSGDGTPPLSNTQGGYSGYNTGIAGSDADLQAIINGAFDNAGVTQDASVLTFKVNADKGVKTIMFDVVFGSDEYPEWSSSTFVDIAAVMVNGKNAAFFGGDPKKPLSILDQNKGYFQDNTTGAIQFEYDGISNKLTVIAKVKEGVTDIKIAIADTGDSIYDSGIFTANIRSSNKDLEGILNEIAGTAGKDNLKAVKGIDNVLFGGGGKDKLQANTGFDILYGDESAEGSSSASMASKGAALKTAINKDKFIFKSKKMLDKSIDKTDIIADFDKKDVIDFSKMIKPKFDFIGKSKFSKDGDGEVRYKQVKSEGYTAVYVDTNGDGKVDASLKILGLHKMNSGDFVL